MGDGDFNPDAAADEGNCYSDRQKLFCERYIYCVSCTSFIVGLVLAIYGYVSIEGADLSQPGSGEYISTDFSVEANAVVAYMCIAGGILAVIIAILGCLTARCKNFLVTCPFGLIAFIVAILAFAVAGAIFASDTAQQIRQDACERPLEIYKVGNEDLTGEAYMKQQYGGLVDDKMCSDDCLCDKAQFEDSGISEITDAILQADYGDVGRELADSGGSFLLLQYPASGNTMTSYDECYSQEIEGTSQQVEGSDNQWEEFVNNGGHEYMSQLEEDYKCASICYKPLFYLKSDISEAPVQKECVEAFIDKYSGNLGVGIVAIVTGLVLLSACIGSVPLCSSYSSDSNSVFGGS